MGNLCTSRKSARSRFHWTWDLRSLQIKYAKQHYKFSVFHGSFTQPPGPVFIFFFFLTLFRFTLCSYTEIVPFVKHVLSMYYLWQVCTVKWRNPVLHCVFSFLNTETFSILGDGREKKKVHFCSWKSLVDLINLIVLGIFDIPTCLHTTAATCCHLKSKYRITAIWDFIVYHAYFRNYFCKVKMTLTLKACVIKPQQSVCWVCTYYVLIIKRKM